MTSLYFNSYSKIFNQFRDKFSEKVDAIYPYHFYKNYSKYECDNQFVGIFLCIKGIPFVIYFLERDLKHGDRSFERQTESIIEAVTEIIEISESWNIPAITKYDAIKAIQKKLQPYKYKCVFNDLDNWTFESVINSDNPILEYNGDKSLLAEYETFIGKYNEEKSELTGIISKLPEIQKSYHYKAVDDVIADKIAGAYQKLQKQIEKINQQRISIHFLCFHEIDSSVLKVVENGKTKNQILKPYCINRYLFQSKSGIVTGLNFYEVLGMCNKLSYAFGYEPCYYVKSKFSENLTANPEEWIKKSSKNPIVTVLCNFEMDGFRLPTFAELVYGIQQNHTDKNELKEYVWSFPGKNPYAQKEEFNNEYAGFSQSIKENMSLSSVDPWGKNENFSFRLCRSAINNHTDITVEFNKEQQEKNKLQYQAQREENQKIRNEKEKKYDELLGKIRDENLKEYSDEQKENKIYTFNKINFVKVLKGKALFGNVREPVEKVVESFYMGQVPVTREQYKEVMEINENSDSDKTIPVTDLTLIEMAKFCNTLSAMENLEACYYIRRSKEDYDDISMWDNIIAEKRKWSFNIKKDANGYRLPTEEEWIYAAKAGIYLQNTRFSGGDNVEEVGWSYKDTIDCPQKVAQKNPNKLGIYDLTGNVWELCNENIAKGGSFKKENEGMSINSKLDTSNIKKRDDLGFRVVRAILG